MKKTALLLLCIIAHTLPIGAQAIFGCSKHFALPTTSDTKTEAFFCHFITNKKEYTTLTLKLSVDENIQITKRDKVVIEYSDITADTTEIHTVNQSGVVYAEFVVNTGNLKKKPLHRILIEDKCSISISNDKRTELCKKVFEEHISKAVSIARKNKKNSKAARRPMKNLGIGASAGIVSLPKEGFIGLYYGAYISCYNIYADFRMVPAQETNIDGSFSTGIIQANAGYRIKILNGFGATPLVGITQFKTSSDEKTLREKTYVNYGVMFDHTYFTPKKRFGIKTGITVQRHNFGMTFGVAYIL